MNFFTGHGQTGSEEDGYIQIDVNGTPIWFRHKFESSAVRSLVMDSIEEKMCTRVQAIRRSAYIMGKKASRSKESRVTEFNGCINDASYVGYNDAE